MRQLPWQRVGPTLVLILVMVGLLQLGLIVLTGAGGSAWLFVGLGLLDVGLLAAAALAIRPSLYQRRLAHARLEQRVHERTAELEARNQELHALAARLEAVREEERTRISREVHDRLGQALTGLKMDVTWLRRHLGTTSDPGIVEVLARMTDLLDETVQDVRRIASELRPGVLDDFGLTAALEWLAGDFQTRCGIACVTDLEEIDVPPASATACFRICQEALCNVVRHAGADLVQIGLRAEDGKAVFCVSDNGRGAADAALTRPGAMGLLGMRERAAQVGGTLSVIGKPGHGTTLVLVLPLGQDGVS